MAFDLDPSLATRWNRDSVVRSNLFNSLSVFLPAGEQFFVQTVRQNQARSAPAGATAEGELTAFVMQESAHKKQHEIYNRRLETRCPSARGCGRYMEASWPIKRALMTGMSALAVTVVIEHMTTTIARIVLDRPGVLGGDTEYAMLWRWHALEELEHKEVAFDFYRSLRGSGAFLKLVMAIVSIVFLLEYGWVYVRLMADERQLFRGSNWSELLKVCRSTSCRRMVAEYLRFFGTRFSPSALDDSALVAAWRADSELSAHLVRART